MRLIDADAIPWTDLNDDPNSKIRVLVTFADKVNKMPTIEPQRTGKWIFPYGDRKYKKCSACERVYYSIPHDSNYCPNCGTKME